MESHLQPLTSSSGKTGLINLGNTCYMNSALQCILHIPELNYYFLSGYYKEEVNHDNPLGNGGRIAEIFAALIHSLFALKRSHQSSFSPRDFKSTIGRYNSMFASYHQQDSQEFLSYLLDGLHEDLNRIINKPYTEKPELTNTAHADQQEIEQLARKSWDTHKLRNDSVINDLFVGLYKSTLVCPECSKISVTFDPYNALTLPLPSDQSWCHKVLILPESGYPKTFEVELTKKSTFNDLKNYLSLKLSIPVSELICMEIFNHQFFKNYESKDADIGYMPIDGLIQKDDIVIFYQLKHSQGDLIVPVFNTISHGSDAKPFGLPFFITLSEEDRYSFGVIRAKLEKRYDQLSTYNYFKQVRSKQEKVFHTIHDFPLLDEKFGEEYAANLKEKVDSDLDGYESDISLANPDIQGDYGFNVKLFDSSKEMKPRYKYHYNYNTVDDEDDDNEIGDDELWVPKTCNNFKNLPTLLEKLPERKRAFYSYKECMFDGSSIEKEEDHPAVEKNFSGLDETMEDIEDLGDISKASLDKISTDTEMSEAESDLPVQSVVGSEPDLVSTVTTGQESIVSVDENALDGENEPVHEQEALVAEKNALVCEWDPELFDIFFTGIEEEGEGGKETWENPEEIPNDELIQKRKIEQENSVGTKNITLYDCLRLFEQPEVLSDEDLWYCPSCKKHTKATKCLEIWSTPDILTIHLKRFENQRSLSDKIDDVVEFPIEGLDMSPYVVSDDEGKNVVYDLFAVDNHYGGLGGGHYTAYVRNFVDDSWYYYDDSRVNPRDPAESISGNAYLLFYRKRQEVLGGPKLREIIEKERTRQAEELKNDLQKVRAAEKEFEAKQREIEAKEQNNGAEDEEEEIAEETKSLSSSDTGSTTMPVHSSSSIAAPLPHHLSMLQNSEHLVPTTNSSSFHKRRKGNLSSPVLSPLHSVDDLGENDLESVKSAPYSPGMIPANGTSMTNIPSSSGKVSQSSGLVDSPTSLFDNENAKPEN